MGSRNIMDRLRSGWPFLALVGAFILALLKLIAMRCWVHWDMVEFFFPVYVYASDVFRSGHIPLWNPFQDCGVPFFSDFQSHTWYPIRQLIFWTTGYNFYALQYELLLHLFLAGCGMYLLARRLSVSSVGSSLSGIAYMLSGFFVTHAQDMMWVIGFAWAPWLIAGLEGLISTGRRRHVFELIGYGVMLLLAGYPGIILAAALYMFIYLIYRVMDRRGQGSAIKDLTPRMGWLVFAGVMVVGLCAIQYVPSLYDAGVYGGRLAGVDYNDAMNSNALPVPAISTLLIPALAVAVDAKRQVFGADLSMVNIYFGLIALALAIYAVIRRAHRDCYFLFIIGVIFLLAAFGGPGLLRPLMFETLPLFKSFRNSSLFGGFFILSFCLLAGMGLDLLSQADDDERRLFRRAIIIALVLYLLLFGGVSAWYFRWLKADGEFARAIQTGFLNGMPFQILILFLAVMALSVKLSNNGKRRAVFILVIAALDSALMVQTNMYAMAEPPSPYLLKFIKEDLPRRRKDMPLVSNTAPREDNWDQLDHFGMLRKVFQTGNHNAFRNETYVTILEGGLHTVLATAPRYFLLSRAYYEPDQNLALELIKRAAAKKEMPLIVDQDIPELRRSDTPGVPVAELNSNRVKIMEYSFNKVVLKVFTDGPELLAGTETYHPGWKASVDGKNAAVLKMNEVFRAVTIPAAGVHLVDFEFRPDSFRWGVIISVIFSVCLVLFGIVSVAQTVLRKKAQL